jgi:regulator of protease activity HflC (stomatin/prohibitin superfamily)
MDRNIKTIGLINWVILLIAGAASAFVAGYVRSDAGWVTTIYLALGFLIAFVSYFQIRLIENERLEKLEFDELNRQKNSATLFASTEADTFPARRSREQFERFFVPGFTLLLLGLEIAALWWMWNSIPKSPSLIAGRGAVGMSAYGVLGLVLFLMGKYSAGLARLERQSLLRPASGFLLLGGYASFIIAATVAGVEAGFPKLDDQVARGLCVILGLLAVETTLGLLFEIYRPRVRGKAGRLLYDSRLVGLLSQPEGIIRTAAQALDYQFGFKVSETWFYRFLEKALAWIILLQVAVLALSSTVVFIEPGEQGLIERFGRPLPDRPVLQPGAHMKLPWPIEKVQRYTNTGLQSFNIGFVPTAEKEKEKTVLWTVSHYKEEVHMLVASKDSAGGTNTTEGTVPVSLLTVSIPVQYEINDVRAFAYNYANAGQILENIATREVVQYLVGIDLNEIMSVGRWKAAQDLQKRIQEAADQIKLGVKIMFVGLQDIHPPVGVAAAFEEVVGAHIDNHSKELAAEGYRSRTVAMAEADGIRQVRQAETYRFNKLADATARASQFTNQMTAFAAAPKVYPQRLYFQTMARSVAGARKYVVSSTNTQDVIQMNLEDKLRPDLLDVQVPTGARR